MRKCTCCDGTGEKISPEFTSEGVVYRRKVFVCGPCVGRGTFAEPDQAAILKAITGRHGLRKAAPRAYGDDWRPYYVWCMTRYDLGLDGAMPVKAGYMIDGDPYKAELDVMVAYLATKFVDRRVTKGRGFAGVSPELGEDRRGH